MGSILFDPFHTQQARNELPALRQKTREAAEKALAVGLLTQQEFTGLTDGSIGADDEFVTRDLLTCIEKPDSSARCKRAPSVTGDQRTNLLRDLFTAAEEQRNLERWAQPISSAEKQAVVWGQLARAFSQDWF